jgi:hypothetical protein
MTTVQFCSNCAEPFPIDDPMLDYDGNTYCSPNCVRELLSNEDPCDHAAWVEANERFAARLSGILGHAYDVSMPTSEISPPQISHADLVTLTSFMADHDEFPRSEIARAVEKPWNYLDVLAEAKAEIDADRG